MIPKQNRLSIVAKVIETAKADSITGNFETQGSKFSQETPKVATGVLSNYR